MSDVLYPFVVMFDTKAVPEREVPTLALLACCVGRPRPSHIGTFVLVNKHRKERPNEADSQTGLFLVIRTLLQLDIGFMSAERLRGLIDELGETFDTTNAGV